MKRRFFIFFLATILLLETGVAFAQNLEIQYPTLPNGVRLTLQPTLPEFILYLYYFLLMASGAIAIGSLVAGGIKYITSGGNTAHQTEARQRISGAFLGILVLMGSSILLGTINPNLRILQFTKPASPIQACDCKNPAEGLCKRLCLPAEQQKQIGAELLEVPVGNLIDRIMNETTLAEFDTISKQAEKLAFSAKEAARKYKEELDACECSNAKSQCDINLQCSDKLPCKGEPCDKTALANKKRMLENANTALTQYIETSIGINASLASGMSPDAGGTPVAGGSCAAGTGACSPSSLSAFGAKAGEASQICQKESGGDVFALNDGCLRGQYDYSVGLFQINLFNTGRCPGAFEIIGKDARGNASTCKIIDQNILSECTQRYGYGNADVNIQGAKGISSGGQNWCPWTTANPQHCNLCSR